jgi:ribosomal protein S14
MSRLQIKNSKKMSGNVRLAKAINKMDLKHMSSAQCKKCGSTNAVIRYMVDAALNTARQQQEELELKGYNKFH